MLQGFAIATATLHVMGAVVGFGAGVLMLKKNMVDCEDWDLFAVLSGHYGAHARDRFGNRIPRADQAPEENSSEEVQPTKRSRSRGPSAARIQQQLAAIEELIADGDFAEAADELHNLRIKERQATLPETAFKDLATGLCKAKLWDEALPLMKEFIELYPEQAAPVRMRLANYHLTVTDDSRSALQTLKPVDRTKLSEEARTTFQKLVRTAKSRLKSDDQ